MSEGSGNISYQELKKILQSIPGIPFEYYRFDVGKAPDLPFGVFYATRSEAIKADGKVIETFQEYEIELYTQEKSPETEQKLEAVLDSAEISYQVTDETYLDEESMYMRTYEIQI